MVTTGMRDFLPAEKKRREALLHAIKSVYQKNGFSEIETPAVEDIRNLKSSDGGDNIKMTFDILRRRLKPETVAAATDNPAALADSGLRYDLTVPLARFYCDNRAFLPPVFKSIQVAPVWRAERPQKGRFRQFVQCDIDIIGEDSVAAEIELITVTASVLDALGVDGYEVRMNDRRLLNRFLDEAEVPEGARQAALVALDKNDKLSQEEISAELFSLGLSTASVQNLMASYSLAGEDELASVISAVNEVIGAPVAVFDPTLVRGMGYYTGIIFEVRVPSESYSLGGGGRYDRMIGRTLSQDVPAVGFSLGFERLAGVAADIAKPEKLVAALLYSAEESIVPLLKLSRGMSSQVDEVRLVKKARNTKKQLNDLAAEGFNRFAFVTSESTPGTTVLRELQ